MEYKVGSLFAGIGGIDLGIKNAKLPNGDGYSLVWANEIDEHACVTYKTNFEHTLIQGDINKVLHPSSCINDSPEEYEYYSKMNEQILKDRIDILTGGFPCQAFSIAGEMRGFEDERGNLFWSIINLVKQLDEKHGKPRILFLENVKNLMAHDGGQTYKVIKSEIEKLGYIVKEHILNTMEYSNLPQNRERIYIFCFLNKEDADRFTLFENIKSYKKKFSKSDRENQILQIIDYSDSVPGKYYYSKEKYPIYYGERRNEQNDIESKTDNDYINLDEQITEFYQFYQLRRGMYVRKNQSNVCPTLTANMGTGGHNVPLILNHKGIRKLTPVETLKLQGFPINAGYEIPLKFEGKLYSDSYLYKQAGNAVSVPVIQFLATELLKVLSDNEKNDKKEKATQLELF